ncbi:hypothetical protein Q8F55_000567 [Vanrija albida]|uniref:Transmembrane protein n=1 Tax=Vanrija albida TaxID=181172 RepID=A0ABR3QDN1_9TREE
MTRQLRTLAACVLAAAVAEAAPLVARAQNSNKPKKNSISRRTLLLATLLPLLCLVLIGASLCACEMRSRMRQKAYTHAAPTSYEQMAEMRESAAKELANRRKSMREESRQSRRISMKEAMEVLDDGAEPRQTQRDSVQAMFSRFEVPTEPVPPLPKEFEQPLGRARSKSESRGSKPKKEGKVRKHFRAGSASSIGKAF